MFQFYPLFNLVSIIGYVFLLFFVFSFVIQPSNLPHTLPPPFPAKQPLPYIFLNFSLYPYGACVWGGGGLMVFGGGGKTRGGGGGKRGCGMGRRGSGGEGRSGRTWGEGVVGERAQ